VNFTEALAKNANIEIDEAEQILTVISNEARVFQAEQSGFDRRFIRKLEKEGKMEAEIARELADLLKRFESWLGSIDRNPQTEAELRHELDDFLTAAQERQRGRFSPGKIGDKTVPDTRGQVGAAVQLRDPNVALGQVLGRDLKDYTAALEKARLDGSVVDVAVERAKSILSGLLKAWDARRPLPKVQEIMDGFAHEFAGVRQQILALTDPKQIKQVNALKKELTTRARELVAGARTGALQEILNDPQLHDEIESIAVVVEKTESGSSISFEVNLGTPVAKEASAAATVLPDLKIRLNFDHSETDFADAIAAWIKSGNTADLYPIIAGDNMRIVTRMENQGLFNALKKDLKAKPWETGVGASLTSRELDDALKAIDAWDNNVESIASNIETFLGRSLSPEERVVVRDYVDMALKVSGP